MAKFGDICKTDEVRRCPATVSCFSNVTLATSQDARLDRLPHASRKGGGTQYS